MSETTTNLRQVVCYVDPVMKEALVRMAASTRRGSISEVMGRSLEISLEQLLREYPSGQPFNSPTHGRPGRRRTRKPRE